MRARRGLRASGEIALVRTRQEPPPDDEQCPKRKEPEVPRRLVDPGTLADVVQAQEVVIDDPLDDVEKAPPNEHPADEGLSAERPAPVLGSSPENPDTRQYSDPRRGVKQPVRKRVGLQARNRGLGVAAFTREQVVPLEDLMQQDPVYEPSEADAEQDARESRARDRLVRDFGRARTVSADSFRLPFTCYGQRALRLSKCLAMPVQERP